MMSVPGACVPSEVIRQMVAMRRRLHRRPEVSGQERWTSQFIADQIDALGFVCRRGVGGYGVVVDLPGRMEGPVIALRADMDALPIAEATGLPFSSEVPDAMHACGHDGHSAALFGALLLLRTAGPLQYPIRLLWQPAEETARGAAAMIEDGAMDGVQMVFGGHIDGRFAPGQLVVTRGAVNAAVDRLEVSIVGKQAHGARPHEGVDALMAGCQLVQAFQSVVARETQPGDPVVLTIGQFHSGVAHNVLAGSARLTGTLRTVDESTRRAVRQSIVDKARGVELLSGVKVDVRVVPGAPAVINDSLACEIAHRAAVEMVGSEQVRSLPTVNMGGEDFSEYLGRAAGCYVRFGAQLASGAQFPAHSERFDFSEDVLPTAARWFAHVAATAVAVLTGTVSSSKATAES